MAAPTDNLYGRRLKTPVLADDGERSLSTTHRVHSSGSLAEPIGGKRGLSSGGPAVFGPGSDVDALQLVGAGAWSYDHGVVEHISDPFAAVPGLHMAWATCVVVGLWPLADRLRHRAVARLALAGYPALTWATVVVTGNHFLLDGAAGVAVVAGVAGLRSGVAAVRRGGRWILTHRPDQDRVSGQRASPAQQGGGGRDRHDGRAGQHDEVERQSGRGPGQQASQGVHLVGHGSRSAASAASAGQSALEAKNSGMRSGDG